MLAWLFAFFSGLIQRLVHIKSDNDFSDGNNYLRIAYLFCFLIQYLFICLTVKTARELQCKYFKVYLGPQW